MALLDGTYTDTRTLFRDLRQLILLQPTAAFQDMNWKKASELLLHIAFLTGLIYAVTAAYGPGLNPGKNVWAVLVGGTQFILILGVLTILETGILHALLSFTGQHSPGDTYSAVALSTIVAPGLYLVNNAFPLALARVTTPLLFGYLLYIQYAGIRELHGTGKNKAVLSVLASLLLLIGFLVLGPRLTGGFIEYR
ncbi:MAG: YIP1 family protein [Candidatus Nanohaloarchaea archaeon]|nr:YIP1 family protein [Candidatus Nanohaloarchaea archaeon]